MCVNTLPFRCISFFRLVCKSLRVCLHVFWCVSECMCFNLGWRGHIIKTSHFTGIPFTPYCLPHCWKIQVIYQSIQATCVLFPMCFFMHSLLSVYLLWAVFTISILCLIRHSSSSTQICIDEVQMFSFIADRSHM